MSGSPRSKRRLALLAVGLFALLVTAGCAGSIGGLGADGDSGGAHLDSVPASAEYVGYVDAAGMASDESLRSIANTALDARSEYDDDAPADVDAMFEQAENDSGLDPSKVEDVTAFGTTPENPMESDGTSTMVLSTSYSEDDLVAAMEEEGAELAEETYGDTTLYVYEGDESYEGVLAVLGDGTFAVGDRSGVESVVDVRAGDADALGGDLKAAFEDTDDGYVRFAMATPSDGEAAGEVASQAPMDASVLDNISFVSGSFATGDGNLTSTVNLVAASESDAEQTYDFVDGALSLYSGMGEGDSEAQAVLDAVSVEQDGDTVAVTHTDTVENVETYVEGLYGFGAASSSVSGSASGSNSTSASLATVTAGE
jgi:hypothetical protein